MIYAYIRVSTNHQLIANQRYEISAYAAQNKIKISKWIEETISSRTDVEERKLSTILQQLKKGDILIASELSRFGRNLLQVMSILHECMDKNWILEIEQDINSSIFNTCITKEERILSVSNKIMIRFQSYITKLINVTL